MRFACTKKIKDAQLTTTQASEGLGFVSCIEAELNEAKAKEVQERWGRDAEYRLKEIRGKAEYTLKV